MRDKDFKAVMPFLSLRDCYKLIEVAQRVGFESAQGDSYPGRECRITAIDEQLDTNLMEHFSLRFTKKVQPFIQKRYGIWLTQYYSPFIVQYTMDTQQGMDAHSDESDISMSVVLNTDFEGGGLKFEGEDTPIQQAPGWALFFPGDKEHEAVPITEGERYTLTWWLNKK